LVALISLCASAKPLPNIIVIMVDDMGYGGLSCYDNSYFETPQIDQLAADGLLLTDYHSNGASCTPTRAALMTGRYQFRSGCHVVINADRDHKDHIRGMPAEEWTMVEPKRTKPPVRRLVKAKHRSMKAGTACQGLSGPPDA
jgi:arylsulfatase A-like enzyme